MASDESLPTIQTFWYGPTLGRVEQLSLASFLAHGHPVQLFCYSEPSGVPAGVTVRDASTILSEDLVFRYSGRERYANRGSLAGFANWFRYELLYREGGIWVDVDMVCLQPFSFNTSSVFGYETPGVINIAVLGLPAGDRLAKWMSRMCASPNRLVPYDTVPRIREKLKRRFLEGNERGNVQFGEYGPRGFSLALNHFGRTEEAMPIDVFYPIHYDDWRSIYAPDAELPHALTEAHGVHLWNEKTRQAVDFDRNDIHPSSSLFEQLWAHYMRK